MSTGKKIKELRKLRKMTQAQLGEASGVVEGAIRNYEREVRTPSEEQLEKIAPGPDGTIAIDHKAKGAKKLTQALKAWSRALADVESGKMTEAEYELWKASFRA